MKYKLRFTLALVAGAMLAMLGTASINATSNTNDPDYWEDRTDHPAVCYKHEGSHSHGTDNGDGSVTLNPYGADWTGDHWELLVVKSGSVEGGNAVHPHPTAGVAYFGPLNDAGQQGVVSHWIVCKGTTPETTTTTTEVPPSTTTTSLPATTTTTASSTSTTAPAPTTTAPASTSTSVSVAVTTPPSMPTSMPTPSTSMPTVPPSSAPETSPSSTQPSTTTTAPTTTTSSPSPNNSSPDVCIQHISDGPNLSKGDYLILDTFVGATGTTRWAALPCMPYDPCWNIDTGEQVDTWVADWNPGEDGLYFPWGYTRNHLIPCQPAPVDSGVSPQLPETGSGGWLTVTIAAAMLAAGGLASVLARRSR